MPAESSLTIRAELSQLRRDLTSAGNLTEGQAQSMVIALEKRIKAAEKAAKQVAAAQKQATAAQAQAAKVSGDWARKLDGVGQVAAQLPGPLAQIGSMSVGAAKGLGSLGVAGAGVMVAAAAIGALTLGMRALANAALEAEGRLDAAGQAALISESARQSLNDYEAASDRLSIAVDDLTVSLGAGLAPALTTVSNLVSDTIEQWNEVGGVLQWVAAIVSADPAAKVAKDARDAARERATVEREAAEEKLAQLKLLGMVEEDATVDTEIRAAAIRDAAAAVREAVEKERAAEKAVRDHAAALKAAEAEQVAYNKSVLDAVATFDRLAEEQNEAQHNQNMVTFAMERSNKEAADLARRCDEATAAMKGLAGEENQTGLQKLAQGWKDASTNVLAYANAANSIVNNPVADAAVQMFKDLGEISRLQHEQEVAQLQERIDRRRGEIDSWLEGEYAKIDGMVESGEMSEKQAIIAKRAADDEAKAKRKALNQRTKDERKALLDGFDDMKKAQKRMAMVESIRSGIAMIPAFVPIAGPFAPVVAAAAAGTAYKLAADQIDAQPPPEFPMGRVPSADHRQTVSIRDDEAILNGRAVAARGGPEAVRRMNEGRSSDSTTIYVQMGNELVGTAIAGHVQDAIARMIPTPGSYAAGRRILYG